MSVLSTPVFEQAIVPEKKPSISALCGKMIDIIYDKFSDRRGRESRLQQYTPNESKLVDDAMQRFSLMLPKKSTWRMLDNMPFRK